MALPFLQQKPEALLEKTYAPIERVKELANKGFSEVDIIDVLKKEGYTADAIDSALTEALRLGISGVSPPVEGPTSLPTAEEFQPKPAQIEMPETSLPQNYYYPPQQQQQQQYPTEEYIEYVVRERTTDLDDKLKEFMIKYSELEKRMVEVREQINELAKTKTTGDEIIIARLEEVKGLMVDLESRLSGLEKAFKDALPALIESVRALCDIVQRMKREA